MPLPAAPFPSSSSQFDPRAAIAAEEARQQKGAAPHGASAAARGASPPATPPMPLIPTLYDSFLAYDGWHAGGEAEASRSKRGYVELVLVSERWGRDVWQWVNEEPLRFTYEPLRRAIVR